jgi:glycolate oxidase FAD binding subunit
MATTQTLRETAAQAGGHTSLFRAPKLFDHLPLRDSPVSAAVNSIEQRLLQAFDPAGVFSQQARHANPSAR